MGRIVVGAGLPDGAGAVMDLLTAADMAGLLPATFAMGFCCGVMLAAVVWWQASKRRDW